MKLKDDIILHDIGGEHMAVVTGESESSFNGFIRNNETAHMILTLLQEETTTEDIVNDLSEKYDASREQIEAGVLKVIDALRKKRLISE